MFSRAAELRVTVKDSLGVPISNIAVLVKTANEGEKKRKETLTVSQKNKAFSPYFTVMQIGQPLEFSNTDDITHHIFSASRVENFSFKIRKGEVNSSVQFKTPISISMGCNIHDWMSGHILVVDTPYFTLTDEKGIAAIQLDTTGVARVEIWHPQMSPVDKNIQKSLLLTTENISVSITLKNKFGKIPEQTSGDDFDFLDDY